MPTTWTWVFLKNSFTWPSIIFWQTWWEWTSIRFVLEWKVGFSASHIDINATCNSVIIATWDKCYFVILLVLWSPHNLPNGHHKTYENDHWYVKTNSGIVWGSGLMYHKTLLIATMCCFNGLTEETDCMHYVWPFQC